MDSYLTPYLTLSGAPQGVYWKDANGNQPGDPGYDPSTDSNNTDNGDGTFTDNQGNVMDSGGGLISAGPGQSSTDTNSTTADLSGNTNFDAGSGTQAGGQAGPGGSSQPIDSTTSNFVGSPSGSNNSSPSTPSNPSTPNNPSNPSNPNNPSTPNTPSTPSDASAQQLGNLLQNMLNAIGSGNQAAVQEAAREFNQTFGLDQQKFQESVSEYNQTFGLQQAGVTGTYQGQPTLAAQQQAANIAAQAAGLTGIYYAPQGVTGAQAGTVNPGGTTGSASGGITNMQQAWNSLTPQGQAQYLQYNGNNAQSAMAKYWQDSQNAVKQAVQNAGGTYVPQDPNATYVNPNAPAPAAPAQVQQISPPTQQQYITARTAELQQITSMSAAQAQQTALSEWNQGLAQSGNVAGGLPQGISFTSPASNPASSSLGPITAASPATTNPPGGTQTLAYQTLTGIMQNGQLTEAAKEALANEAVAQQQANTAQYTAQANARNQALSAISSAQNDPFRQLMVEYGTANSPGALSLINGSTGQAGANALPKFGAMNGSAQGTGALGLAQQNLATANGGSATSGTGTNGGYTGPNLDVANGLYSNLKSPTDVLARNYITADKATQDAITSAISSNTGLDQSSIDSQIKAQLPTQSGPTFGLATI